MPAFTITLFAQKIPNIFRLYLFHVLSLVSLQTTGKRVVNNYSVESLREHSLSKLL